MSTPVFYPVTKYQLWLLKGLARLTSLRTQTYFRLSLVSAENNFCEPEPGNDFCDVIIFFLFGLSDFMIEWNSSALRSEYLAVVLGLLECYVTEIVKFVAWQPFHLKEYVKLDRIKNRSPCKTKLQTSRTVHPSKYNSKTYEICLFIQQVNHEASSSVGQLRIYFIIIPYRN